jgi:hypothetical protein
VTGTLRLTVELATVPGGEGGGDAELQVAGRVRRDDGAEHPFVGWVGLMAVLHDAVVLAEAGT